MQATQLSDHLELRYGLVIDSDTAARLLGFRTPEGLAKARKTGRLELDMFEIPRRRGLFTSAGHLAQVLLHTLPPAHLPELPSLDKARRPDTCPDYPGKEVKS